jgi:hypothetical protein
MGEKRNAYRVLVAKPEGKKPLEDLNVGVRIILKWILQAEDRVVSTGFNCLRIGTSGTLL